MNVVRTFKHKPIKVPYVYVSVVCGTISVRYVCEIPYLQLFYALACQFSVLHCADLIHIPTYHLKQVLEFKCIICSLSSFMPKHYLISYTVRITSLTTDNRNMSMSMMILNGLTHRIYTVIHERVITCNLILCSFCCDLKVNMIFSLVAAGKQNR